MRNKKVYIVSLCLKHRRDCLHEFHFRGYYRGAKVKRLLVEGGDFKPLEEYIIHAKVKEFKDGALYCKCLRYKSIFNH